MGEYKSAWANAIQDGVVNQAIAEWHSKQAERIQDCATPSTLTDCPRVVWLRYRQKVAPTLPLTWGKAQRMLHGRVFENTIAEQLKASGNLLYHWKDDFAGESIKFEMGEGETRICGTPDLLLKVGDKIAISDAKTSMGKSFGYVPLHPAEAFKDYYWYKHKLQINAYFMLCLKNKDWFTGKTQPAKNIDIVWHEELPLPEACHLFSYALDDGVVRREFQWTPTKEDFEEVLKYVKRWNKAYASETMPDCTCGEFEGNPRKFCYYVTEQETTRTGAKIGIKCCDESLLKEAQNGKD